MIVGIDEVGRGSLAGPVCVGAVSIPDSFSFEDLLRSCSIKRLKDSKKLSKIQRERIFEYLKSRVSWSVGESTALQVDQLGLTKAITRASGYALANIEKDGVEVSKIFVDAGIRHGLEDQIETEEVIRGDETIPCITLASIMAKVYRDKLMIELDLLYPDYGFSSNVGYGTKAHYEGIEKRGLTPEHRMSFLKKLTG